ncbi:putative damage-inducible protein DinB [Paenibacillus harenae]|uniref:Damage-inducible protein DinB n=1 Tax=Paenibacillus harenae TaxID=306543 RepID=A0ABT9U5W2_PAEHA|nr:putative damage-inducible protein DinB [Paenibacillus harenae]
MKTNALQQYDYHVWANKKVNAYLQELTEEVYRKEIQSVFPTI